MLLPLLASSHFALAHEQNLEDIVERSIDSVVVIAVESKKAKKRDRDDGILTLPKDLENSSIKEFYNDIVENETVTDNNRTGSGVVISSNGLVASSLHLIKNAKKIEVSLYKGKKYSGRIVAYDEKSDVVILKLKANNLDVPVFSNLSEVKAGQSAFTIGAPFGYQYSVSSGVVSSVGSRNNVLNGIVAIQSDIAVNPGNSGGPLFSHEGKLLGIISRIISTVGANQGVSFAVPIEKVIQVYNARHEQNTAEGSK